MRRPYFSFNSASCFVIKKGGLIMCGPVVESRVVKHLEGHSKHGSTVHYASRSKGNGSQQGPVCF